ncbi:MAG TPA: DUF6065 family protein [Tepidisphaeraceae bacterium]|nr:DUF6065 family protein [Tepidisphaeraceae bacterium]
MNRTCTDPAASSHNAAEVRSLTAFIVGEENLSLQPAPQQRAWMDKTAHHFANRCLPLLMANQAGWFILSRHDIEIVWDGGSTIDAMRIKSLAGPGKCPASSHFGYGIITWNMPWLFRTPPEFNLLVRGPANSPKDGIYPLEGLVETNWAVATFTMNWKITRPNTPIRFSIGEPIAMIVPQRRGDLETFSASIVPLEADAAIRDGYRAWSASRADFNQSLTHAAPQRPRSAGWEKHYFRGTSPGGAAADGHQVKFSLAPFSRYSAPRRPPNLARIADIPQPAMSCFICSMPRSGSFLLSEALEITGIAGRPQEYFTSLTQWRERLKAKDDSYDQFLKKVLTFGTTPNGIFAAKTHWYQFSSLVREISTLLETDDSSWRDCLSPIFGPIRFVEIRRKDQLRQAISYARAIQSDIWWKIDGIELQPKSPLKFDRHLIDAQLAEIRAHEAAWDHFFQQSQIEPLTVLYEDLVADYAATVHRVLEYLQLAIPPDFSLPAPRLQKQADEETEVWIREYLNGTE